MSLAVSEDPDDIIQLTGSRVASLLRSGWRGPGMERPEFAARSGGEDRSVPALALQFTKHDKIASFDSVAIITSNWVFDMRSSTRLRLSKCHAFAISNAVTFFINIG